jgi:hypothetical protein
MDTKPDTGSRFYWAIVAFTLISVVFFLVGCFGYSDSIDVLEHTAWFQHVSNEGHNRGYFGFIGVAFFYFNSSGLVKYADCSGDTCEVCQSAGSAAFAFTLIATVCAASVLFLTSRRAVQTAVLLPACLAALSAAVAVGVFMSQCFSEFESVSDIAWGPGAALTLVGMLLMLVVVALISISARTGGAGVQPDFQSGYKTGVQYDRHGYHTATAVAVVATSAGPREF